MTDYRPIDCAVYERYELAVMHRGRLRVRWRGSDGLEHLETLIPEDLETCDGEEFLLGRTAGGETRRLRLDRIVDAATLDGDRPNP